MSIQLDGACGAGSNRWLRRWWIFAIARVVDLITAAAFLGIWFTMMIYLVGRSWLWAFVMIPAFCLGALVMQLRSWRFEDWLKERLTR